MNETDLLDALDRRATSAVASLDAATQHAPIPQFVAADQPMRPRGRVLTVAAAVVVMAMVAGAVAILSRDGDPTSVAGRPGVTHLVLPDPAAHGYELVTAFDGNEAIDSELASYFELAVTIQGPADSDDPWAAAVLEYALPEADTTLDGDVVDLGGVDGYVDLSLGMESVGWADGDVVRYMGSSQVDRAELVGLAAAAVAAATPTGEALPGQQVLHSGEVIDVYPMLGSIYGAPRGMSGLAYRVAGTDTGFVLATVPGGEDRWRVSHALAQSVEHVVVRGHDAVIAKFGGVQVWEISWVEDDDTLVRVNGTLAGDPHDLVPILGHLVEVDDAEFAALVAEHPLPQSSDEGSEQGSAIDGDGGSSGPEPTLAHDDVGTALAAVRSDDGNLEWRAELTRLGPGDLRFAMDVSGPRGSAGSEASLDSLERNVALPLVSTRDGWSFIAVGGLIGPEVQTVQLRAADTDEIIDGSGPVTATIDGSEHVVFMAVLGPEWAERRIYVHGVTSTGEVVRVDVALGGG
ncbi:MAG: hypothetical protein JJE52_11420 [Acidimicrobiia bacterium]|nr:hypothetical protein [Acidimicrobiia bacterium]